MLTVAKTYDSLRDFPFWSGAKDNFAKLTDKEIAQLEEELKELAYDHTILTETELNDFLWFEDEVWREWLDISDEDWEKRW